MELHGKSLIGFSSVEAAAEGFFAKSAVDGTVLQPRFYPAAEAQCNAALELAQQAFVDYRCRPAGEIAFFLERIASEIEALGEALLERASLETGLPIVRLEGEKGRTCNQLRAFAQTVREGSWLAASIDRAQPQRAPLPKPDLRRMLQGMGPVVVFGASNFPLAFSVAGGDTASALAAGNPVVVKAHPGHPGTSEMVAQAIVSAAQATGMPEGVFSLLHGSEPGISLVLVRHPLTRAVGFTGSLKAGRAIFDAAAARPQPIPVHAEMGSLNPMFLLPGALQERAEEIAAGLHAGVTGSVGQFCTSPGLIVMQDDKAGERLLKTLIDLFHQTEAGTMLHSGILDAYHAGVERLDSLTQLLARGQTADNRAGAALYQTTAVTFLCTPALGEEVFGPATLVVRCRNRQEMEEVAGNLGGHLTASVHGNSQDLLDFKIGLQRLQTCVGRLIFNGFPTGVEVCPSMQHGGPYPASTDSRFTSVGQAAIARFARPLCYQNCPQEALPPELQDQNPRGIWRTVDGVLTREGW